MELEIGAIFEGKVTGITKFGAFVSLPGGRSGLVHISEVAWTYVNDVSEYLSVGQDVQVKVISVDENNRINLSIKQTTPPPQRPERGERRGGGREGFRQRREGAPRGEGQRREGRPFQGRPQSGGPRSGSASKEPSSFDDMLKRFMSESESKNARLNRGERSRRRGNGRGN
jgi:S1 RNA binding domain protein